MKRYIVEDDFGTKTYIYSEKPPTQEEAQAALNAFYDTGKEPEPPTGQTTQPTQQPMQQPVQQAAMINQATQQSVDPRIAQRIDISRKLQEAQARQAEYSKPYEYSLGGINIGSSDAAKKLMELLAGGQKIAATEGVLPTVGAIGAKMIPGLGQIPGLNAAVGAGVGEYLQESSKEAMQKGIEGYLPSAEKMKEVGKAAAIAGATDLAFWGGGKLLQNLNPFDRAGKAVDAAIQKAAGKTIDGKTYAQLLQKEAESYGGDAGKEIARQIGEEAKKYAGKQIGITQAVDIARKADSMIRSASGSLTTTTADKATQDIIQRIMRGEIRRVTPEVAKALSKFGPLYEMFPKGKVTPVALKWLSKLLMPAAVATGLGVGGSALGKSVQPASIFSQ